MSNETLATTEDKWHQAVDELEAMKEQLTMSQDQNDHLTIAVSIKLTQPPILVANAIGSRIAGQN